MIKRIMFGLVLLLALPQPFAAPEGIDPAKVAAIQELMAITGAEANKTELTRTFSQQLISVLQANNTSLTPTAIKVIQDEVGLVVGEQLASKTLQDKMIRIYARYFTLEELQGLIEFNQSPIGAKANRVMPILLRESMGAAQTWSEEIGPVLTARVTARLRAEGVDISRKSR